MEDDFVDAYVVLPSGRRVRSDDLPGLQLLGRLFKDARYAVGMTQRQLERATDVDQTTISRLENGRLANMSLVKLGRIALVLRDGWRLEDSSARIALPPPPGSADR